MIEDRCYRKHSEWNRIYRNTPSEFDFSALKKLHNGKLPILKKNRRVYNSLVPCYHYQIRSYEQGMYKYNNYKKLDPNNLYQPSYEHIKEVANMFKTGDFTGLKFE